MQNENITEDITKAPYHNKTKQHIINEEITGRDNALNKDL